jgi:hypothetical protein
MNNTLRLTKQTRSLLERIATGFSAERDSADKGRGLNCDIQMALDCSLGRAMTYANEIRCGRITGKAAA